MATGERRGPREKGSACSAPLRRCTKRSITFGSRKPKLRLTSSCCSFWSSATVILTAANLTPAWMTGSLIFPLAGIRQMSSWEQFCTFVREPERRKVGIDGSAVSKSRGTPAAAISVWMIAIMGKEEQISSQHACHRREVFPSCSCASHKYGDPH